MTAATAIATAPREAQGGGVARLYLNQFRNYIHLDLSLDASPIVLMGENGAGKTNLLEALSLLSPGRGLRSTKLGQLTNISAGIAPNPVWSVLAEINCESGPPITIGTSLDKTPSGQERRVIKLNGEPLKSQAELTDWLSIVWVTPHMDQLFCEGASSRRKFLDRLIYSFQSGHSTHIYRYEHTVRERTSLLKSGRFDNQWLDAIEAKISAEAVAITTARLQMVSQLNSYQDENSPFPQFLAHLKGHVEDWLQEAPALQVEERLQNYLRNSRQQDAEAGGASYGAHKSDLRVTHLGKNMPAEFCSTGEQKMLLLAVILAYVRQQLVEGDDMRVHLLLLDDVVTHLDPHHRAVLFEEASKLNSQLWLTGAIEEDFSEMENKAQFLYIDQGTVK